MIRTRMTDLLGITYPILEGGMALASNPGGSPVPERVDNVRRHLRAARRLTDKPLGANVPLQNIGDFADRHTDMLIAERVSVVVTSGGNPKAFTAKLKAAGITVGHVVGNLKQALGAEKAGVDFVVCEGYEAGGIESPDELTTLVFTPLVAERLAIPVVAAGGFADGRGLLAALALGAEGIQMGSAFLATTECHVHQNVKKAIVDAQDAATVMTRRSMGTLSRVLKTDFTLHMQALDQRGAVDELEALLRAAAHLCSGVEISSQYRGQMRGDLVTGESAAGQSVALVKQVQSASSLVRQVAREAEQQLALLQRHFAAAQKPVGLSEPVSD